MSCHSIISRIQLDIGGGIGEAGGTMPPPPKKILRGHYPPPKNYYDTCLVAILTVKPDQNVPHAQHLLIK